ncbi:exosortase-associated EpsI family protein [Planctomycetota bacterium]
MQHWARASIPVAFHWALATIMLLASGILYRYLEPKWGGKGTQSIQLPVPLSTFPDKIGSWVGRKAEIAATTEAYMRRNYADDFVSKGYLRKNPQRYAGLYVVYCASRPTGILGHRPGICYPAYGWIPDGKELSEFTTSSGRLIPCIIERLYKPMPDYAEIVVLSFYVVNGRIAVTENSFSGLMGRNPNFSGDPARYVAQVQISSSLESSVRELAIDVVDTILSYLPDEQGLVETNPEPNDVSTGTVKH